MLYDLFILLLGIAIGQEYNESLPNIKNSSLKMYNNFIKSDFYKKIKEI